jgi:hypothetical protein
MKTSWTELKQGQFVHSCQSVCVIAITRHWCQFLAESEKRIAAMLRIGISTEAGNETDSDPKIDL